MQKELVPARMGLRWNIWQINRMQRIAN